jgi:hypothetical protein
MPRRGRLKIIDQAGNKSASLVVSRQNPNGEHLMTFDTLAARERARLEKQIADLIEEVDYLGFALTDDTLSDPDCADLRHDLWIARNLLRTSRRLLADL